MKYTRYISNEVNNVNTYKNVHGLVQAMFIAWIYLPYALALIGIIILVVGLYFKMRKKSVKKYFLAFLILIAIALVIFLVPGLLIVMLIPH